MMERYDIICGDMWRSKNGDYVRYLEAHAEIERLTKERDEAREWGGQARIRENRAEDARIKAEDERDALQAALKDEMREHQDTVRLVDKAEAERSAIAVAAFKAAADVLDTHGDSAASEALGQRLCCNGYMCGCQGATVGDYLQHLIRSLTTADAQAALEAYGRKKVREGMKMAADLIDQNFDRNGWRAHKAILAAMEKDGGE